MNAEETAAAVAPQPVDAATTVVVVEPHSGWQPVNWRELWRHRELLYFLTWRDVKVRYKQTVLGVAWALLQPFLKMVVLTIVFKNLLGLDRRLMGTTDVQYPWAVFLFAGLLPWQFFSEALRRSSQSVVGSANLVGKVYFPRLVIPLSSVLSASVDFALSFLILVGMMAYYRIAPGMALLAMVPLALVTAVAAVGAGAFLSALNVAYRDFRYVVPFLLEVWMYASPFIWSLGVIESRPLRLLVALNPMCGIIEAHRAAILHGWPVDWGVLAVSVGMALVFLLSGAFYFRRIERQFADII